MKNSYFFFCSCFLSAAVAAAQYPKDETVQPYPRPVIEQKSVQSFNGFTEWKPLHQTEFSVEPRTSLKMTSAGTDPYVLLPPFAPVEPGLFEFRITFKSTAAPKAELFWATQKQPEFCAENAVRFDFEPNTEQAKFYTVRFQTDAPLTRMRLDPGMSEGMTEITNAELYRIKLGAIPKNPVPWVKPSWAENVKDWKTLSNENITVKFADDGTGAQIFSSEHSLIGEIYPLVMWNGKRKTEDDVQGNIFQFPLVPRLPVCVSCVPNSGSIEFRNENENGFPLVVKFTLCEDELRFELSSSVSVFGPVFRPKGIMQEAVLNGAEYLEKGEHSSSTADITTEEHLRFTANPMHITWAFMGLTTEHAGFGLLYDNPAQTQPVFATPDKILSLPDSHYLGLYGNKLSGTVKISLAGSTAALLNELLVWGLKKHSLPELPPRPRDDEEQRKLNLTAFEKSLIVNPSGWQHAATPGVEKQFFPAIYGNDFVSAIWQLSGKLPNIPRLDHGGGHLRNPASFFLMQKGQEFLDWTGNETEHITAQQKPDGSFRYAGKYLQGHWEDTASGHCGNFLYQLMYNYRILGDSDILISVRKGLEFANRYSVPRGAQVWELSLHTPDIMGSSRMCMANVWMYEATGEPQFLQHAERWAVTGLPFVYLREISGTADRLNPPFIMKYATIPVFGATNWTAPNWMGLPVQWCGLDYSEALFMLAQHSKILDWKKIAEGILTAAEQMQYTDGHSIGLLPDSFVLLTQRRNPHDINPSVLVMQRRRLQGKIDSVDVAVSSDKKYRVVSPFRTKIENNTAIIEGQKGITYQILINGKELRTVESKGEDRVDLTTKPEIVK